MSQQLVLGVLLLFAISSRALNNGVSGALRGMSGRLRMSSGGISSIRFDNRNLRELPVDHSTEDSRPVHNSVWARAKLQPVRKPTVVAYSEDAMSLLGIDAEKISEQEIEKYFSGNEAIPDSGCEPYAHCYCGHQFGSFAGQLGDGAATYLGEVMLSDGSRQELALKGSGKTAFSRRSDGRKVLRSSIREFLGSEAMHFLGIPTTRSASCVTSSSTVQRDPFYDGHVIDEPCTIITRVARSFFRFGSFEIFKKKEGAAEMHREGPSAGNEGLKKQLLDYCVTNYFDFDGSMSMEQKYEAFLRENVVRAAKLVAMWDSTGFVHGVLNTDNMSILGITIDYGPYAFLEHFDSDMTPNGSDSTGRYTWARQAQMIEWNLGKLAEALQPLIPAERGEAIVADFQALYKAEFLRLMRRKLGLLTEQPDDEDLWLKLLDTLESCSTDFPDFFRALTLYNQQISEWNVSSLSPQKNPLSLQSSKSLAGDIALERLVSRSATPTELINTYKKKIRIHKLSMHPQQIDMLVGMLRDKPEDVEKMFGVDAETVREEVMGEKSKLDRLVIATTRIKQLEGMNPTTKSASDRDALQAWLNDYFERLQRDDDAFIANMQGQGQGAGRVEGRVGFDDSVSQVEYDVGGEEAEARAHLARFELMEDANPTFVLRNWVAQEAIEAAEKGDHSKVRTVLRMLSRPYSAKYCSFSAEESGQQGAGGAPLSPARSSASASSTYTQCSAEERPFVRKAPAHASGVFCTCSS